MPWVVAVRKCPESVEDRTEVGVNCIDLWVGVVLTDLWSLGVNGPVLGVAWIDSWMGVALTDPCLLGMAWIGSWVGVALTDPCSLGVAWMELSLVGVVVD